MRQKIGKMYVFGTEYNQRRTHLRHNQSKHGVADHESIDPRKPFDFHSSTPKLKESPGRAFRMFACPNFSWRVFSMQASMFPMLSRTDDGVYTSQAEEEDKGKDKDWCFFV